MDKFSRCLILPSLILAAALALATGTRASADVNWVGSWEACPAPAPAPDPTQSGSGPTIYQNQTVREVVHLTIGGNQLRVRLSNRYGASPLIIGAASVALRTQGSTIATDTLQTLTFGGQETVTIPPGADIFSDVVSLPIPPQTELAVSLYIPGPSPATSIHIEQRSAVYTALENQVSASSLPISSSGSADHQPWVWLDGVDVDATSDAPAIVALGDSITDGAQLTRDKARDWPTLLSQRLQQAHRPGAVLDAGLSGNRLLHDGSWPPFGVSALARFDSDVLAQSNVKSVIVLLGVNDIGQVDAGSPDAVTAAKVEWALTQIAARAHAHGLKIYIGTLTPFAVTTIKDYYSPEKDQRRQAVNAWIRTQKRYDGVVDFDKIVRDPAHPLQLLPAYDSGDHLHPGDAGAQAMANAIPLDWFR